MQSLKPSASGSGADGVAIAVPLPFTSWISSFAFSPAGLPFTVARSKFTVERFGMAERPAPPDLSTPLEETPKLIEPVANGEVDIALGSRALDRSLIGVHQPWRREQAGRIFNLLVRIATGLPFWDTQCGFKAFRLDACRPMLEAAQIEGFAFDVELLSLAYRVGLRIREVPVRWNHAEGSKVSFFRDSLRMLREVIALRQGTTASQSST